MALNIFDVLKEENLNKEYLIINKELNISAQVKVSKTIDGSLFLESSNVDIIEIWPTDNIIMEDFIDINTEEKRYA